jgi:exopolyphosphatase/guanosine-5'-triphosphate,3'-diphosphate pyrophosphatase
MRRAVIDIGTNSVKLLVAEVGAGGVFPLLEQSEQTRLGRGFYPDHRLQPEPIERTARAVATFGERAREQSAESIRVIGTSAARDAVNQSELVNALKATSGLTLEIISGEQEADWAFAGVRTDPALARGPVLILDVGGGSTEFILGQGAHPDFRRSFPLGTVRLAERIRPSDPPTEGEWRRCRSSIEEFLAHTAAAELDLRLDSRDERTVLVGTGGTTSILAAIELGLTTFDRQRMERVSLSREQLWHYQKRLWSLPLAARQTIPGLPPNRADVILFGTALFALIMERWHFKEVRVSTRGLRFGALLAP